MGTIFVPEGEVITEAPQSLQLEITHLCNKHCLLCDARIGSSDYKYLTKEEYSYLASCIRPSDLKSVGLIGGEPLCHPHFEWLADQLIHDFGEILIYITTNGLLLPQLSGRLLNRLRIFISPYAGFNDDIVAEFESRDNVFIRARKTFWNPYRNPNLAVYVAKEVHAVCSPTRVARVVGTKLYGCCLAEPTERYYHTKSVHVKFAESWKEDWRSLPTWRVCQHCFAAMDLYGGRIEGVPCDEDLTWHYEQGLRIGERLLEA